MPSYDRSGSSQDSGGNGRTGTGSALAPGKRTLVEGIAGPAKAHPAREARQPELDSLKTAAPVTTFLGDRDRRDALEEHVGKPKLSGNVRDALTLAAEVADKEEPTARAAVEERLKRLGFDLDKQPELYESIVARVRSAPLTINLRTNIIELLLQGGEYLNQWERSVHPDKGEKAFHGGGKYAVDRNETEKVLHGMPEMEEIGEAAGEISGGWDERNQASVSSAQRKIDELPVLQQRQQVLTAEIASLETVVNDLTMRAGGLGRDNPEATKAIQGQYAAKYQELEAKKQQIEKLDEQIEKLEAEMPSLELALEQAQQDVQAGKGSIGDVKTDKAGFREKRSMPTDRPHSAAVNSSFRAGSAPKTTYGTSHLVLNEDVKDRSTLVGGDSLEQVYKKMSPEQALAAVGTFEHLGVVLLHAQDSTLRMLAEEAADPDAPRNHRKGHTETGLYLEAQVFGSIKMSRDVSKIVIDEDDLDAWEKGLLVDYQNQKLPPRTKAESKQRIESYARENGIDVQYIRTGAFDKPGGFGALRGPGEHLAARRQGWEETGEATLKAFRDGKWATGLELSASARDMGKGSVLGPSYTASGLTELAKAMARLQGLAAQTSLKHSEEQLKQLAGETLTSFFASPFSPDHLDEVKRVLTNSIVALRTCIERSLSAEAARQDGNR